MGAVSAIAADLALFWPGRPRAMSTMAIQNLLSHTVGAARC